LSRGFPSLSDSFEKAIEEFVWEKSLTGVQLLGAGWRDTKTIMHFARRNTHLVALPHSSWIVLRRCAPVQKGRLEKKTIDL
jgi:hypothetical protein